MVASASCGCGTGTALPKKIRRDLLEDLTSRTNLSVKEVKALYARFRRLAPNGYLMPDKFNQTLGAIGLTDDPFIPERMFQVFDKDRDGKLSFFEFASSLAVMIRGSEDAKLQLSFEMAAGQNTGISNEDFRKLIRACNATMSCLVATSRHATDTEDIDRLFHDLSSDDGGLTDNESRSISLESFKAAAQSNEDFLTCLGLDSAPKRPHDSNSRKSSSGFRTPHASSGGTAATALSVQAFGSSPVSSPTNVAPQASSSTLLPSPRSTVVSAAQLQDLRDRVNSLRQVVLSSHTAAGSSGRSTQPVRREASLGRAPVRELSSNEDSDEHWWTPLSRRDAEALASGSKKPDTHTRPPSLEEVQLEFDRVFKWCDEHSGVLGGEAIVAPTPRPKQEARTMDSFCNLDFAVPDCREDVLPGLEKANIHRPGMHRTFVDKEPSNNPKNNATLSQARSYSPSAVSSHRRRRQHRLLGPKKGIAVHFGHENWNMVVSMMVGIRMSVCRSKHEISRELQPVDFIMKEKFSIIPRLANVFDSAVSKRVTVTRFVDYAPLVFQRIRQSFGIHHDDYLRSIGPEGLLGNLVLGNLASLSELSSEGKSGAFFYYTADGNYMIKTVAPKEKRLLKHMLQRYYDHITQNPSTLIVRFLGLHCLRVRRAKKNSKPAKALFFVVMGNMFNAPMEIHRRYDLKGSWIGRVTPQAENGQHDPTVALKDVDFTHFKECIHVGDERKAKLMIQIQKDSIFLSENNIIDYSLLLGIHDLSAGSVPTAITEDEATAQPTAFGSAAFPGSPTSQAGKDISKLLEMSSSPLPIHQSHMGGMLSSDKRYLYYMGIIDILTPYDTFKRVEHTVKSLRHDWRGVSCCPPAYYAERFTNFLREACK